MKIVLDTPLQSKPAPEVFFDAVTFNLRENEIVIDWSARDEDGQPIKTGSRVLVGPVAAVIATGAGNAGETLAHHLARIVFTWAQAEFPQLAGTVDYSL